MSELILLMGKYPGNGPEAGCGDWAEGSGRAGLRVSKVASPGGL